MYEGDNAIMAPRLLNIAHRICLGLLPTSTKSWPLAVGVARCDCEVIIHVHENVLDQEIPTWSMDTVKQFQRLFDEQGKSMKVESIWLETVKSYAPHIYHVVLDLKCTPV